jgi:hypothetical protein
MPGSVITAFVTGADLSNPTTVDGMELRVRVPGNAASGDALPLENIVGSVSSQPGLTVSVK